MKKSIVYTRTGDSGTTSLVGGSRVSKDSTRIEAYGTIDELNSHIGMVMSSTPGNAAGQVAAELKFVQNRLFDIGGYLACEPADDGTTMPPPGVTPADVARIEEAIDRIDSLLPRHNRFVLPSGTPLAAMTHVARTVCRRAERRIVALSAQAPVAEIVVRFINRLSDYLFVLARFNNVSQGADEIFWEKNC